MPKTKKKYIKKESDRLTKGYLQGGKKGTFIIKVY